MNLKSVGEEAADCRAAFEGVAVGSLVVHCHHEVLAELLSFPAERRINYILTSKNRNEQALRLRLFRPVEESILRGIPKLGEAIAEWRKAKAELGKANAEWRKANSELYKARAERDRAVAECVRCGNEEVIE